MSEFGVKVVPYKVTKSRRTKAFTNIVRVGFGQGKRRESTRVSIRVSLVIREKLEEISPRTASNHKIVTFRALSQ